MQGKKIQNFRSRFYKNIERLSLSKQKLSKSNQKNILQQKNYDLDKKIYNLDKKNQQIDKKNQQKIQQMDKKIILNINNQQNETFVRRKSRISSLKIQQVKNCRLKLQNKQNKQQFQPIHGKTMIFQNPHKIYQKIQKKHRSSDINKLKENNQINFINNMNNQNNDIDMNKNRILKKSSLKESYDAKNIDNNNDDGEIKDSKQRKGLIGIIEQKQQRQQKEDFNINEEHKISQQSQLKFIKKQNNENSIKKFNQLNQIIIQSKQIQNNHHDGDNKMTKSTNNNRAQQFICTQIFNINYQVNGNQKINKNSHINNHHTPPTQNEPKKYQSIGITTDIRLLSDNYDEFLKFKLSQKQVYSKMKHLFQSIDNLSSIDQQLINQRYKFLKQNYLTRLSRNNGRQRHVEELLQDIITSQTAYLKNMNVFLQNINKTNSKNLQKLTYVLRYCKSVMLRLKRNIDEVLCPEVKSKEKIKEKNKNKLEGQRDKDNILIIENQNCDVLNNDGDSNNITNTNNITIAINNEINHNNNKQNDKKNIISPHILQKLNQKWTDSIKLFEVFECNELAKQQNQTQQLMREVRTVQISMQGWIEKIKEKNVLIKSCVGEIEKLPEMSMMIYGMSDDPQARKEMVNLQNMGILINDIPELNNFFKKNQKQIDEKNMQALFKEALEYKCLTCSYLKSKMRFVYHKNNELVPVIKILNHLIT